MMKNCDGEVVGSDKAVGQMWATQWKSEQELQWAYVFTFWAPTMVVNRYVCLETSLCSHIWPVCTEINMQVYPMVHMLMIFTSLLHIYPTKHVDKQDAYTYTYSILTHLFHWPNLCWWWVTWLHMLRHWELWCSETHHLTLDHKMALERRGSSCYRDSWSAISSEGE